jgi:exonuclease VII large subunit
MNDDDLRRLFEEARRHVDETAAETRRHVDDKAAETQHHFDETAADMRRHVDETAAETRRHFDVSTEAFRHELRLLAESVDVKINRLSDDLHDLREETAQGFADTQSMIKFSHAELDRRVTSLEQSVADLQARVGRLETNTH